MTKKKERQRLTMAIKKATGLSVAQASQAARRALRFDLFSAPRLPCIEHTGGGQRASCGCCIELPRVEVVGPRGRFVLREEGR